MWFRQPVNLDYEILRILYQVGSLNQVGTGKGGIIDNRTDKKLNTTPFHYAAIVALLNEPEKNQRLAT
jgi:hypothetical protein